MAKTLVRQAINADFPTLLSIDRASFPPGIAYDSSELSYFMQREGAQTLVAEVDGAIAGFLLMETLFRRKYATMVTLDIREPFRRQGHASALVQHSVDILRSNHIERYELQVDVTNSAANAFYEKHGFVKVRVLPNYYANGHDAYLMIKQL